MSLTPWIRRANTSITTLQADIITIQGRLDNIGIQVAPSVDAQVAEASQFTAFTDAERLLLWQNIESRTPPAGQTTVVTATRVNHATFPVPSTYVIRISDTVSGVVDYDTTDIDTSSLVAVATGGAASRPIVTSHYADETAALNAAPSGYWLIEQTDPNQNGLWEWSTVLDGPIQRLTQGSGGANVVTGTLVPQSGWSAIVNAQVDKAYDADATTSQEQADVTGTMIQDLLSAGVFTA